MEETEATFSSTHEIFCRLIKRLSTPTPINTKLLHRALTLWFYSASKYKQLCAHDENLAKMAEERIERELIQVKNSLTDDWIVSHFSEKFGSPMIRSKVYSSGKEDIKVSNFCIAV